MTSRKTELNNVIARRFLRPSLRAPEGAKQSKRTGSEQAAQSKNEIASGALHPRNDELRISQFKFVNRGFSETLLLIPGWATDYRVFDPLDLDFNYLVPTIFSISGFENTLMETLKTESLGKMSILGWSMGGFLASDFAGKHPELVNEIILIGMRKKYDSSGLDKIKEYITTNKNGYLYKFYRECMMPEDKRALSLFKNYIKEMTAEGLLEGLDYLDGSELSREKLKGVRMRFIHGEGDRIAPVDGILSLKAEFPKADFVILKNAGHMPFLRDDFKKVFYGR